MFEATQAKAQLRGIGYEVEFILGPLLAAGRGAVTRPAAYHSHSIVPGGFEVMS